MVARVSNTAFASPFDVDPFSMTEEELEGEQLQLVEPVEEEEPVTSDLYQQSYQALGQQTYNPLSTVINPQQQAAMDNVVSLLSNMPPIDLGLPDDFVLGSGITEEFLETIPDRMEQDLLEELQSYNISEEQINTALESDNSYRALGELKEDFATSSFEDWTKQYSEVQESNPDEFARLYNDLPPQGQLQFLYSQYKEGSLDKKEYEQQFANIVNRVADQNFASGTDDNPFYLVNVEDQWYLNRKNNTDLTKMFEGFSFYPKEDENLSSFLQNIGATNNIQWTDDFDASILQNPVLSLAASIIPFGNLALTGAQLAADVDVNPLQAASGLLQGLQLAGVVRPPSAPLAEGLQGPPDVGEGLFGTTYAQTESLITAASAGNVEEAAMGMFGGQLVNEGLAQAGIAPETLGLTQQELTSGVNTTVNALAQGAELDEALAEGFGRQLVEGVVDAIPTGDAPSLGFIEDAIRPIVEPVIDAVEQIAEPFVEVVEQVGPQIEDAIRAGGEALEPIVEPIVETASAIGSPIEDIVREVGPPIEDAAREIGEALEPVVETIEELGPPIEDVVRAGGELLEPVGQLLGEVVDLGDISRGYSMPRGAVMGVPQRTQIENLFDRELFQFEEEIGISPEYLELFGLPDNIEFYEADGTIIPVSTEPRVYSF